MKSWGKQSRNQADLNTGKLGEVELFHFFRQSPLAQAHMLGGIRAIDKNRPLGRRQVGHRVVREAPGEDGTLRE